MGTTLNAFYEKFSVVNHPQLTLSNFLLTPIYFFKKNLQKILYMRKNKNLAKFEKK